MTEEKYIKWSDLIAFMRQHVSPGLYAENFIKLLETIPQVDVEPNRKNIVGINIYCPKCGTKTDLVGTTQVKVGNCQACGEKMDVELLKGEDNDTTK